MNEAGMSGAGLICVQVAVPGRRNVWSSKQATLRYDSSRLVEAEGIEFAQAGPHGLTGTLYLVTGTFCRDNRRIMRVERRKIVDGKVAEVQNWGELEDAPLHAA